MFTQVFCVITQAKGGRERGEVLLFLRLVPHFPGKLESCRRGRERRERGRRERRER